jgi:hypothetical protein
MSIKNKDTDIIPASLVERPSKASSRKPKSPVNPQLDEEGILATLQMPLALGALQHIRRAAVFAVMDAFDRDVNREFFAAILSDCVNLNETAQRLELVAAVYKDFEDGTLTAEKLDEYGEALGHTFEKYRVLTLEHATLVSEMAHAGTVIH